MRYFRFTLCCLFGLFLAGAVGAVTLSADTSRPEMSTFIPGEAIMLKFNVAGLTAADAGLTLQLKITNEEDTVLLEKTLPIAADAQGNCATSFAAPNVKMGFYRVYAKLSNGVTLPKLGSRMAGYLTYCIVPDPAQRKLYPAEETFFGMQGGFSREVNVLPYLGIRWVMGGYNWHRFEPKRSGELAEARAAAKKAGKRFEGGNPWEWCHVTSAGKDIPWPVYEVHMLNSPPAWASIPETVACASAALNPEGEKGWRAYCLEAGRAVAEAYPDAKEHIYQLTWEPVSPWGFKGTDEQLIRIYEIGYPALHETDPKAVVIGPTNAGISATALDMDVRLLKKGIGKYLDGYATHPYHAILPEPEGYITHVRALQEAIRQYAGKPLQICGTEQGFDTQGDQGKELLQARGLIRENLIALGEGWKLNYAFYIADCDGYGYYYNLDPRIPFGTTLTCPKPIAPAYAAQSFLLEGHHSVGAIEWLGETSWGYAFERPGSLVLALWDYSGQPHQVSVPVGVAQVTAYDWMGNARVMPTDKGNLTVTLTQDPVYITGVSPALWGKDAKHPLTFKSTRYTTFPGAQCVVIGEVSDTQGKGFTGSMLVEADAKLNVAKMQLPVKLAPGAKQSVPIRLAIPANTPLGTYTVTVSLADANGRVAATGLMVTLLPSITITSAMPTQVAGKPALRVTLQEAKGVALQGNVLTVIKGVPESKQTAPFSLSAKGMASVVLPYDDVDLDATRIYDAQVTVTTKAGEKYERTCPFNYLAAAKLHTAPVIDGQLTEWAKIPALDLKGKKYVVRSPQFYTGALAARVQYAWDEKGLYLAYTVTDPTYVQEYTGINTWNGDCLQLGFDLDPGKQTQESGNTLADASIKHRYTEIDLALTKTGPEVFRTMSFDPARFPSSLVPTVRLAVTRTPAGLNYEAFIPWETLGATEPMHAGTVIGIGGAVNDKADTKQADPCALGLFNGIAGKKDPTQFGTLLLAE
ncbi:MAG TPA: sugar-binding protein [Armatimonadota bacterium]|jgi:hypothetical protein